MLLTLWLTPPPQPPEGWYEDVLVVVEDLRNIVELGLGIVVFLLVAFLVSSWAR